MFDIPSPFGSMKDLLRRAEKARENWEMWRSIHQEAYDFAAPQRETLRFWSPGQRKNRHIFDSTAVDGLVTFSNRLQGSIVPSWIKWMNLVAGDEVPEEDKDRVNTLLEQQTKIFFNAINHSNLSTEITPAFSDLGIGTGAIEINEGDFAKAEGVKFTNVPLAELWPETPICGKIENVWRQQEIEAGHIMQTWRDAKLPEQLAERAKKNPNSKEKILNGMLLNPTDSKYYQFVIHKNMKALIFSQSFLSKRLIVFRWHVTPGETFGRGPIMQKMSDIRTVNKVKQFILENAAIQMAGIYTGVDDGVFNPHTVRIAPGTIIPVASNKSTEPSLQALPRAGDIGLGGIVLEDLQNSIRKSLMSDPMGEISDPVRTATEQMMRMQEALKDRGASYGRLKSELIEPLVNAVVDILSSLGKMAPIKVDGKQVTMKHESPLAKAEETEEFQNSQVWFSMVSQLPPEIAAGAVRVENLPRFWAEKLSVPLDLVRTEEERQELAENIMQQAQQAQMQGQPTA